MDSWGLLYSGYLVLPDLKQSAPDVLAVADPPASIVSTVAVHT
jgi:hypothetical protein